MPLINGKPEREAFSFVDERRVGRLQLCAATAPATFYMEEEHGMARIYRQHGDAPEVIEEAKAACPVNCIKDINFDGLVKAEQERRTQAINNAGRLTQRAEGKAPRTILEGLVDTDDPEYQAREKARELEHQMEGLKTSRVAFPRTPVFLALRVSFNSIWRLGWCRQAVGIAQPSTRTPVDAPGGTIISPTVTQVDMDNRGIGGDLCLRTSARGTAVLRRPEVVGLQDSV